MAEESDRHFRNLEDYIRCLDAIYFPEYPDLQDSDINSFLDRYAADKIKHDQLYLIYHV